MEAETWAVEEEVMEVEVMILKVFLCFIQKYLTTVIFTLAAVHCITTVEDWHLDIHVLIGGHRSQVVIMVSIVQCHRLHCLL